MAQSDGFGLDNRPFMTGGPACLYWQAKSDRAFQFVIPVSLVWPVNDRLTLDVTMSPSANQINTSKSTALSGLSDSRVRGAYVFGDDRFLLTCGLNLPTGKSKLTWDELNAANVLAMQPLDFILPVLGQGLECNTGLVMAQRFKKLVVGFGAGFLYRGKYRPYSESDYDYDPGEEVSVSVAFDFPIGRQNKFMLDLIYTSYGADRAEGTDVFQAGARVTAQAGVFLPSEYVDFQVGICNRWRAKNKIGSEELTPERLNSNGNKLDLLSMASMPLSRKTKLFALLDGKIYSNNDYDYGGATICGFGGGFTRIVSQNVQYQMDMRLYVGSLDTGAEKVNLTGIKFLTGLVYSL
ncbi:hypothetical protein JW935_18325 [candidate division KSB1 bacterium]|nr:hypothetical protein [candidate division KSB1 bacterium]